MISLVFLVPTRFDSWLAGYLAHHLRKHPLFDLCVASGITHNLLGGIWYAAALFILWVQGRQPGEEATRRRILTTFAGSLIAAALTVIAGGVISWPAPAHSPGLAAMYMYYMGQNPSVNSFPSQSTALYASVTAGVYSLHKSTGWLLWSAILLLVALPRMYVGGHYFTDIVAGLALGLAGYAGARYLLENTLIDRIDLVFGSKTKLQVFAELVVFAWILQVALEFRDVVWARNSLKYLLG
ncbi:MAG TPA: phosphatase PAP2 family protein [Terriglobia bacterium]|nr:phosphatase PAP2 family protein [Terriglobia bacterium]